MDIIRKGKQEVRKALRTILSSIPSQQLEAESSSICEQLFVHPSFVKASRISLFLSMPMGEVRTEEIVKRIFESQKRLFVPLCKAKTMKMLEVSSFNDYITLECNSWGIAEPKETDNRSNAFDEGLDLVIMPGVAFDVDRNRIGYGAGYYDRFLCQLTSIQGDTFTTIALALRQQMIKEVPTEETDIKPNHIITSQFKE